MAPLPENALPGEAPQENKLLRRTGRLEQYVEIKHDKKAQAWDAVVGGADLILVKGQLDNALREHLRKIVEFAEEDERLGIRSGMSEEERTMIRNNASK